MNAAILTWLDDYMHRKLGEEKRRLCAALDGVVVEIGSGTGANMRYFEPGTRLVAVEPGASMHRLLREGAARHDIDLELLPVGAQEMPMPDASVDAVLSTLVLCTVADPEAVLAEILRVLRPGGVFVCLEHVCAPEPGALDTLQRALRGPWRWAFQGCDLCRDTGATLRAAGFSSVEIERVTWRTAIVPISPMIVATCTR